MSIGNPERTVFVDQVGGKARTSRFALGAAAYRCRCSAGIASALCKRRVKRPRQQWGDFPFRRIFSERERGFLAGPEAGDDSGRVSGLRKRVAPGVTQRSTCANWRRNFNCGPGPLTHEHGLPKD